VVPGVLPVRDFNKMAQFAKRCGASVPKALHDHFEPAVHDPSLTVALGQAYAEAFIDALQQRGYSHFHIYTLNQPVQLAQCITGTHTGESTAVNA
jgi:methylenetetrahydrofolate reductase (NADPH)